MFLSFDFSATFRREVHKVRRWMATDRDHGQAVDRPARNEGGNAAEDAPEKAHRYTTKASEIRGERGDLRIDGNTAEETTPRMATEAEVDGDAITLSPTDPSFLDTTQQ